MTAAQVVTWLVMLLTGGVMGAFLNWWVTDRRGRVQPIHYRQRVVTLAPEAEGWAVKTAITVTTPDERYYEVNKLFLVEVELTNRSNRVSWLIIHPHIPAGAVSGAAPLGRG